METFTAFDYAVASTAEIIKGTAPDQADLPTPCSEWDVRALLSHVIGTLWLTEALFTGQAPRYPMALAASPIPIRAGTIPSRLTRRPRPRRWRRSGRATP